MIESRALHVDNIKSLRIQQDNIMIDGTKKEKEAVLEALQEELDAYTDTMDSIKDIQKEVAENSPLKKLREEMKKGGGLQNLRDSLFKDGVTQQEKTLLLRTAGPEGQRRFEDIFTRLSGRVSDPTKREEIALRTLNAQLRDEMKKGNLTEEQQVDLLTRIAEAMESGKGAILFTEK